MPLKENKVKSKTNETKRGKMVMNDKTKIKVLGSILIWKGLVKCIYSKDTVKVFYF